MLADNRPDQVLAFERGDYLFVFNFNPVQSFTDYGVQTRPGKYNIVLNTDNLIYGGNGNVDEKLNYFAQVGGKLNDPHFLRMYIPARTGIVSKKFRHLQCIRFVDLLIC